MAKYRVSQKFGDNDSDVRGYEIIAADLSDAQQIVLDREGYKVVLADALIDYSLYYQRNKRYAGIKLGNSNLSFQNYSCFTVCLAFMVKKDPLEVHEILKKAGAYSGANIISEKAAKALGLELLRGSEGEIAGKMTDINYMPKFQTIKEVLLGKSQHFVVRLIDENGKRSIFDPWTGKIQSVNYYPFKSYRLFRAK